MEKLTNTSSRSYFILFAILLILAGIGYMVYVKTTEQNQPAFSPRNMLDSLWYYYKKENLEEGTFRALDKDQNNITTSEGQSYTMLRAVWVDDKETFDAAWKWTKDNMQHSDDQLFSWLFGQRADGTYGILTEQHGGTAASDADTDIALALLFASKRWNDNTYYGDAVEIIRDIWAKEVITINGRPYLTANDIDIHNPEVDFVILNPSYFAPYAYRIFKAVDPKNDWLGLVDSSYTVIEDNASLSLDAISSAGIPSNWISLNKRTGKISPIANSPNLNTNFSYDALRLPWRLALDATWFDEPRAKKFFADTDFFANEWRDRAHIYANYTHDGSIAEWTETPAMYGGIIGYFMFHDPEIAKQVYYKRLESLYNVDTFNWENKLSYYDKNWAWFGLALYNNMLPQLYPLK